eukprot:5578967-Pyramimonas_sp.AAC.1
MAPRGPRKGPKRAPRGLQEGPNIGHAKELSRDRSWAPRSAILELQAGPKMAPRESSRVTDLGPL